MAGNGFRQYTQTEKGLLLPAAFDIEFLYLCSGLRTHHETVMVSVLFSERPRLTKIRLIPRAWVVELVDTRDLKSLEACPRASSILAPGTRFFGLIPGGSESFQGFSAIASRYPGRHRHGEKRTA